MTFKELVQQTCKERNINVKNLLIGVYYNNNGKELVCPEYADELLETHSNREIIDNTYFEEKNILVVEFKKET